MLLRDGLLQNVCDMFLWLHHHGHELLGHGERGAGMEGCVGLGRGLLSTAASPGRPCRPARPWLCRAEDWCRVCALQLCVWPGVGCEVCKCAGPLEEGTQGDCLRHVRRSGSLRAGLRAQSFYFLLGHLGQGSGTHAIRFRRQTPAASSDGHKRDG